MTRRKIPPPGFNDQGAPSTGSDKAREAAEEAQRLGSQGAWAEDHVPHTPASTMTPSASVAGDNDYREGHHNHALQEMDAPPTYQDSTGGSLHGSSHTAGRSLKSQQPLSSVCNLSIPADNDSSSADVHSTSQAEHLSLLEYTDEDLFDPKIHVPQVPHRRTFRKVLLIVLGCLLNTLLILLILKGTNTVRKRTYLFRPTLTSVC